MNKAYSQGVEAEAAYEFKSVRQKIGYTYLQANGIDASTNGRYATLGFTPKHKIDYRADVRLPWRTMTTLNIVYLHKQWTGIDESGVEIPGYTVANLRISKMIGNAEIFVACNNLFDRHYAETADSFGNPFGSARYFPQPGRNYMGGLTVRFLK